MSLRGLRCVSLALGLASLATAAVAGPLTITVDLTHSGRRGTFRPDTALGAGIDGAQAGEIDRLFTPRNIAAMRSLGLGSTTYRLRTELGIEAWHWTEQGTWSDAAHARGYWTGSAQTNQPIALSWGYQLPRRGDTQDNANNTGWSRLTDGDLASFWKSNPYLDRRFTHDRRPHPQWIELRLDAPARIDAVQIAWANPYATAYEVQYWTGQDDYDDEGRWRAFPSGAVRHGRGGVETRRLAAAPIRTQYLRILLRTSSGTAPAGSADIRDRLGYAVREVGFGTLDADGGFHDVIRHAASHAGQTFTHVSSTDPWHRAIDRDPDLEQVGIDRFFTSGIAGGLPAMLPVGVLFDTPDDAAALVSYLERRGYPLARIELGEEPDGQYGEPADYAALYLETAAAIRRIDRHTPLGGPSMQSAATELPLVEAARKSWNAGFIRYLRARGRLSALQFFSFEHYPFDDICGDIHAKLVAEDPLLESMLARLAKEGVPRTIPWVIAEYGFSAFSGQAMVELPSALLQADIVGHFLSAGGRAAYMFGYGPNVPINQHLPCAGFGNMTPFLADPQGQAGAPLPVFFASRLISRGWLQPGHGRHRLYAARVGGQASPGAVVAYAVRRPDRRLALLILNRSAKSVAAARLAIKGGEALRGPLEVWRYSPAQYQWLPDGVHGHPVRDLPPAHAEAAAAGLLSLPPESLTVVVGRPQR